MELKRGRPIGHKLSEESKDKIRKSRTGKAQTGETKTKISNSLKNYFKSPAGINAKELMRQRWKNFYESDEGKRYMEERATIMKELWDCDCGKYRKKMSAHFEKGPKLMWSGSSK